MAPFMIYALSLFAITFIGRPGERLTFGVVTTILGIPGLALSLFAIVASRMTHGVA